jgi:hypothetical protein
MTFPSLNLDKLKRDTIQRLEQEKKNKEDQQLIEERRFKYQNMMNINHIKKSDSFKQVKEQYYDLDLLEKEFEDFLQSHQLFTSKETIENHLKDKNNQDITPFILRKEMKYLDTILTNRDKIRDR